MQRESDHNGQPLGERILEQACRRARLAWADRLVAVYALGSLAHGGFSAHVSDVDMALVLGDPLQDGDAQTVEALARAVKATGAPLAERLSVFWGTLGTLSGTTGGGRFPPVDRLDLKQSGRLLFGQDIRESVATPSVQDMVVSAAGVSSRSLSSDAVSAQLKDSARLIAAGVRPLTKRILFPVRYLFTARTGRIGTTDAAVEHFVGEQDGPPAELVSNALEWRYQPPDLRDPAVSRCVEKGLLPLYRLFIEDHEKRLRDYGELELAQAFGQLRQRYR
jgi:hypothetical protein